MFERLIGFTHAKAFSTFHLLHITYPGKQINLVPRAPLSSLHEVFLTIYSKLLECRLDEAALTRRLLIDASQMTRDGVSRHIKHRLFVCFCLLSKAVDSYTPRIPVTVKKNYVSLFFQSVSQALTNRMLRAVDPNRVPEGLMMKA